MLQAILAHKPKEWEYASYDRVRYKTFELREHSAEYNSISQYFDMDWIMNIERVQHPYAYGRFLLRKDQNIMTQLSKKEVYLFHQIQEQDLNIALEYNCDPRHYEYTHYNDKKSPEFLKEPDYSTNTVIIIKHLRGDLSPSNSNYYSAYVVSLFED